MSKGAINNPMEEEVLKSALVECQHERNELSKALALANQKIAELEAERNKLAKDNFDLGYRLAELEADLSREQTKRVVADERIAQLEEEIEVRIEAQAAQITNNRNQEKRIAELEEWIRNKRDTNFAFACEHLAGWTKEKDSFYAECTEILEKGKK